MRTASSLLLLLQGTAATTVNMCVCFSAPFFPLCELSSHYILRACHSESAALLPMLPSTFLTLPLTALAVRTFTTE